MNVVACSIGCFREKRALASAFAVTLLVSCVQPPPIVEPDIDVRLPKTWPDTSALRVDALDAAETRPWWESFEDAALSRAIEEALTYNRDLHAAAARLFSVAANARIAGADLAPRADLGVNASRRKQNFVGLPIPGQGGVLTTRSTSWALSLDVSWEIDVWGRLRSRTSAALADVQASASDLVAARLSLAARVAKIWFGVAEARRQVELAEETAASFRATAGDVQARYDRGLRPSLDVRLSLSNAATAEATLAERRRQLDALLRDAEILLGRYPKGELHAGATLPEVAGALEGYVPSEPVELFSSRPDLAALERRLAASGARVSEARAALFHGLL